MGISLGGIIVFVCLLGEAEGLKCSHSERKNLLKAIGSLVWVNQKTWVEFGEYVGVQVCRWVLYPVCEADLQAKGRCRWMQIPHVSDSRPITLKYHLNIPFAHACIHIAFLVLSPPAARHILTLLQGRDGKGRDQYSCMIRISQPLLMSVQLDIMDKTSPRSLSPATPLSQLHRYSLGIFYLIVLIIDDGLRSKKRSRFTWWYGQNLLIKLDILSGVMQLSPQRYKTRHDCPPFLIL